MKIMVLCLTDEFATDDIDGVHHFHMTKPHQALDSGDLAAIQSAINDDWKVQLWVEDSDDEASTPN